MAINVDISQFLTNAGEQKTGEKPITTLDYQKVVQVASEEGWDWGTKEDFLKKLSPVLISTMYPTGEYYSNTNDVFYQNSEKFGAITRIINSEMPQIIENRAWSQITSGETQIGCNIAYLPVVDEQLFGGTTSWAVPFTDLGDRLDVAFRNASEFSRFESELRLQVKNAIEFHREVLLGTNRNNWIGEKFALHNVGTAGKKHVVNLVEEYCRMFGKQSMTAVEFYNDEKALRFAPKIFHKYRALLSGMTTMFTSKPDSKGRFIPRDRMVFQCLSDFAGLLDVMMYSTTFHDNFVTMPLYREVASWQALVGETASADFNVLSSINATTASGSSIGESGIVGIMVDQWAILHTTVSRRVGIQRDDIKNIVLEDHQFTDRYVNNMFLNGCVFVIADYTAA